MGDTDVLPFPVVFSHVSTGEDGKRTHKGVQAIKRPQRTGDRFLWASIAASHYNNPAYPRRRCPIEKSVLCLRVAGDDLRRQAPEDRFHERLAQFGYVLGRTVPCERARQATVQAAAAPAVPVSVPLAGNMPLPDDPTVKGRGLPSSPSDSGPNRQAD